MFIQNPAKVKVILKFVIAEALYMDYRDLDPLLSLVELRNKFSVPITLVERLILYMYLSHVFKLAAKYGTKLNC